MNSFLPLFDPSEIVFIRQTKNLAVKTITAFIFCVVVFQIDANAQAGPAANISGPLKAYLKGGNISLTSSIATSSSAPKIVYAFSKNTSGASIVSKGPFIYDSVNA